MEDKWYKWLADRRYGGDPQAIVEAIRQLSPIRDRILDSASISTGDLVVDVGTGDGLLGFGALSRLGTEGKIWFSDISADCISGCRELYNSMNSDVPAEFIVSSAEDMVHIGNCEASVVVLRSVLLYVTNKQQAFREFYRVLKPDGRLSLYEPIIEFSKRHRGPHDLNGLDLTPIADIDDKVTAGYRALQKGDPALMTAFTTDDLFSYAKDAGFRMITLHFSGYKQPAAQLSWDYLYRAAPNPNSPTLEEVVTEFLTPQEQETFIEFVKGEIARGAGTRYFAEAYLQATK